MRKFDTPALITAVLDIPAGRIRFLAADRTDTTVELRGVGRLGDVACKAFGVVTIDEAASGHVAAPVGDVTVGRLTGPAEITTQQGSIHIAEAASDTVVLRTRMGDVTIGAADGVSASLDAGTRHGRIQNALTNTEGAAAGLNIHATTDMGNIVARSL